VTVKFPIWIELATLCLAAGLAVAQEAKTLPPPPDQDPFVGEWKANSEESRPKLSRAERSYVRTIRRAGEEVLFSSVGGASKAKVRNFRLKCDGAFYPLPTGPVLSCRWVDTNRVEGETRDPNGKKNYWMREVSPDGQRMTVTGYKNQSRTKIDSVMVLERVK
jgi:hypothetical protein